MIYTSCLGNRRTRKMNKVGLNCQSTISYIVCHITSIAPSQTTYQLLCILSGIDVHGYQEDPKPPVLGMQGAI
jgi:hypothetical protein